ncbi:hypothetical protein QWY77_07860 [Thalassotalea ponticola]|uniref:hypothetical protein n=1 Tax=Thalassotalea ponticola TaxID=1523392 RepID=UPI0025B4148B|nr:hypothetical protein [Thalassotalea ponticola]MDN3652677.1 hypothetical protein [Thalassotalea ponticola]
MRNKIKTLTTSATLLFSVSVPFVASAQSTDAQLQRFKTELVELAADVKALEEAMLHPDADQVAVYLSVDAGDLFQVTAVTLLIDGQRVHRVHYTTEQSNALHRGGVDRVFIGDVGVGEHNVVAYISGIDKRGNKTKRGLTTDFVKSADANAIELRIDADTSFERVILSATEL